MMYVEMSIVVIVGLLLFIGYLFYRIAAYPKTRSYEMIYEKHVESKQFDEKFISSLSKESFNIKSDKGYELHCLWIENGKSEKTVILSHGIKMSMVALYRYIEMYYNKGFNVFLLDHRYHGKSGGGNVGFGYHEKYDMKKCVDWICEKVGRQSIIGTHGESMGAAIVLQHAAIDNRVDFVVADCPFESLYKQFKFRLKEEYRLPAFPLLHIASLISKVMGNGFFMDVNPKKAVRNVKTPILFVHGKGDEYIPVEDSQHLYEAKLEGYKKLYLVEDADHVESYSVDSKGYEATIMTFLEEINV